ncbi:MAG: alpha/beta fold hydrolase [Pyrinomonadaceae bacterium]
MQNQKIHFAHANGFPARTYSKLFSFLEDEFDIAYIEKLAHNPRFPVTNNWNNLSDELIEDIEKKFTTPIIGLGHSLGGVLHLIAAAKRNELYTAIVLLDAMIISPFSSFFIKTLKSTKLMSHVSPSRITRFRRTHWRDFDDVFAHFSAKESFARFDPDVLRDYVRYGTVEQVNGTRRLLFEPAIEAKIYETIPDHLPRLKGRLNLPIAFIEGTESNESKLARVKFMKKKFPFDFTSTNGTHLFPFEHPKATAFEIKGALRRILPD